MLKLIKGKLLLPAQRTKSEPAWRHDIIICPNIVYKDILLPSPLRVNPDGPVNQLTMKPSLRNTDPPKD